MTLSASRRLPWLLACCFRWPRPCGGGPLSQEYPPAFLDDFLIGAFLLYGAWRCSRDRINRRIVLAAAWAFACGLGYASFFTHIRRLEAPDPAGIPDVWVATIIGFGWVLCILVLIATIRSTDEPTHVPDDR